MTGQGDGGRTAVGGNVVASVSPTASDEVVLAAPPEQPLVAGRPFLDPVLRLLPLLAGAAVLLAAVLGEHRPAVVAVATVLYALAMVGMFLTQGGRRDDDLARRRDAGRSVFAHRLGSARRTVRGAAAEQWRGAVVQHPAPAVLWTLTRGDRVWQRRPGDEDFAVLRIGLGTQPLRRPLRVPDAGPDADPYATHALARFVSTHGMVRSVPTTIELGGLDDLWISGPPEECRALARSLVAQLLTWHAPHDARLMVAAAPAAMHRWEWLKWAPHTHHPTRCDAAGSLRLMATRASALAQVLGDPAATVHSAAQVVVLCDGIDDVVPALFSIEGVPSVGVHVAARPARLGPRSAQLELLDGAVVLTRGAAQVAEPLGVPDLLDEGDAERLTRCLAPMAATSAGAPSRVDPQRRDLLAVLGVGDLVGLDVGALWRHRPFSDRMRVPIGVDDRGRPVLLDLRDPVAGGTGPHAVVLGAPGAGVPELLRTVVLGLALTHPPEQLAMLLIEGGDEPVFDTLGTLPHVAGHVPTLQGSSARADRLRQVMAGEVARRRRLLSDAGVSSRDAYEAARPAGVPLAAMPSLLIVVNGFGDLVQQDPEFVDDVRRLARAGAALGMHLLLASERSLVETVQVLDDWFGARVTLRTQTAAESRAALGTPAAAELPQAPGDGYLRTDAAAVVRFATLEVSGPAARLRPRRPRVRGRVDAVPFTVVSDPPAAGRDVAPAVGDLATEPPAEPETLAELAVSRIRAAAPPIPLMWRPEPASSPGLRTLLDTVPRRRLCIPIGLVDRPREHRVDPLVLDLAGAGGHVGLVGGPGSGVSTLLRSLVLAMSATHTPAQAGCYLLDFGGGGFAGLAHLPQVGSIAGSADAGAPGGHDRVRRMVAEVAAALAAREVQFTELGLEGMADYRTGRAAGAVPADRFPTDLFLVVDGWERLIQLFPDLQEAIARIAAVGLDHGVHVVLAAGSWQGIPPALRDSLGTRWELRLAHPDESLHGRQRQQALPGGPGVGLAPDGCRFVGAVPRLDGVDGVDGLAGAEQAAVETVRAGWDGPAMAPVRLLPLNVPVAALPAVVNDGIVRRVPFAIDETRLAPVSFDPLRHTGLLVFGRHGSGRSTALRVLVQGLQRRYGGGEAKILAIDLRRDLLGVVDDDHELGYAASVAAAEPLVRELADALRVRLPGPEVNQQQLRDRSWWRGLEVFVVVDDLDLLQELAPDLLEPLVPLVPHSVDVGLHVLVARSSRGLRGEGLDGQPDGQAGGQADGQYSGGPDAFLSSLRAQDCCTLVLAGDPGGGAVLGVPPQPLPPGRGVWVRPGRSHPVVVQVANASEGSGATVGRADGDDWA